jgi:hypothetical protein
MINFETPPQKKHVNGLLMHYFCFLETSGNLLRGDVVRQTLKNRLISFFNYEKKKYIC